MDLQKGNNIISCLLFVKTTFFCSCNNDVKTGFTEVDNQFRFNRKIDSTFQEFSKKANIYFLDKESDSIYLVINEPNDKISRGWVYNNLRIGDWVFENEKNEVDSIINYIQYNNIYHINTIKYFANNALQKSRGYSHQFHYKKENIKQDKPIEIDLELVYDKEKYIGSPQLFLFKDPKLIKDFSDFLRWDKDSVPSFGEDAYYLRITPRDKGVNRIQGYYILVSKKEFENVDTKAQPVFFILEMNVD